VGQNYPKLNILTSLVIMPLTEKQKAALAAAPPAQRNALRAGYNKQNSVSARPKAKSRAQPKSKAISPGGRRRWVQKQKLGSALVPARGHGYYDAFRNPPSNVAFPASMGEATPLRGITRFTTPSTSLNLSNGPLLLVVYNDVAGKYVASSFNIADKNDSDNPTWTRFQASQFESAPIDTPFIPTRQSIRITNVSNVVDRGGVVRVLRTNNLDPRFKWYQAQSYNDTNFPNRLTVAHIKEVMEEIRDSPKSRSFGAEDLGRQKQWNCYITDLAASTNFIDRQITPYGWQSSIPAGSEGFVKEAAASPPMSTFLFLIEPHGVESNAFEVSISSHRLYRFPYGSLLASFAMDVPYMAPDAAHKVKSHEESHENNLGSYVSAGMDALAGAGAAVLSQYAKASANSMNTLGAPAAMEMAPLVMSL
jgi:hypothetical protein